MRWMILVTLAVLTACTEIATGPATAPGAASEVVLQTPAEAARGFISVVENVEPTAERICRARTRGVNCDFRIQVDRRVSEPSNAFQSVDKSGRPILTFTVALIAEARNTDELAFIMGHEAAHHILGHLQRQAENAAAGAEIFAGLATLTGGTARDVAKAQELGAVVGARTYSKEFELEADRLGTLIAYRAGYDPLKGAQFFARIPDPGNRFLGTHPPNAARYSTVVNTLTSLQTSG